MTDITPAKLAYNAFEPAGGADASLSPIIFLHGVTATKENWQDIPQVIADATKRKAYSVDGRNHGDSEYTDHYNFDLNAIDVIHFMDTIKASKAVLVGHSMGGITSIQAALKHPERIEAIFIEDMFVKKCPKELGEAICGLINLWIAGLQSAPKHLEQKEAIEHAVEFLYSKIPPNSPFIPPKEMLRESRQNMELRRLEDGGFDVKFNKVAVLRSLTDTSTIMSEPTGQYEGPAYFIYGSISPFCVGKEEEHIKKHFPKAKMIEFEGATHTVHSEFPQKYSETIIQFLK